MFVSEMSLVSMEKFVAYQPGVLDIYILV